MIKMDSSQAWAKPFFDKLNVYQTTGDYKPTTYASKNAHPYFEFSSWTEASLEYRGQLNADQRLLYDLTQDMVFMAHPVTSFPVTLDPFFLEWFMMEDHFFTKVEGQEGYFERLFESEEISLYKKYFKTRVIDESTESFKYILEEKYYLKYNKDWVRVRGKRTFTKLFPDQKKQINDFYKNEIRAAGKSELENTALLLTEYILNSITQ
jgi:hypothetical protein